MNSTEIDLKTVVSHFYKPVKQNTQCWSYLLMTKRFDYEMCRLHHPSVPVKTTHEVCGIDVWANLRWRMKAEGLMGGLECANVLLCPLRKRRLECVCVFRNFVKTGCSICEFQAKYCCGLFWKLRSDMAAKHFYNSDRRLVSMSMCISSENVLFHYCDYLCSIRGPRCYCNSCLHLKHTHLSSFYSLCLSY